MCLSEVDNQCASCSKSFTEAECDEGALIEVDEVRWETGHDKSDPERRCEVHGYKFVCEECYDNDSGEM